MLSVLKLVCVSSQRAPKRMAARSLRLAMAFLPLYCGAVSPCQAVRDALDTNLNDTARQAQIDHVRKLIRAMTLEEKAGEMIDHAPAIPRLGIAAYDWWNEGLHGVARAGAATVFPQAIGLAATWDAPLLHQIGNEIAAEAHEKRSEVIAGVARSEYRGLTFWSPNVNIFRDPRWGRGQETYGEDPFLTATMAVAFIGGIQGPDRLRPQAIATPKHFAVHSGPEPLRHTFDARISPHDLADTYLPAFRAAIVEAGAGSVMCSYNEVDGAPACASDDLLGATLRKGWHFQGYVTSDCGAINDFVDGHKTAHSVAEAAAQALRAGTDLDCGKEYLQLPQAVAKGLVSEQEIDRALERLFLARASLGLLDAPSASETKPPAAGTIGSEVHRALAFQAAEESLVLLQNRESALPLSPAVRSIAVIGPSANELDVLEGNYNGTPINATTVLAGIQKEWQGRAKVVFAPGSSLAEGLPLTVPGYVLTQPNSAKPGVLAEYYSNPRFEGTPYTTEPEAELNFDWRERSPVAGIPSRGYSVRWSTTLLPYFSGRVRIGIDREHCWDCETADPAKFYVDGKVVASDDGTGRNGVQSAVELNLETGKPVHLQAEYSNTSGDAAIRLIWLPPADALRAEAVEIAMRSDAVVMVLGLSPAVEGEEMPISIDGFKGGDRTRLELPRAQTELYEAVRSTHKPIHVVLLNGSPLSVAAIHDTAASVLEAWYPGEEGGRAVAAVLAGKYNPGGRLPLTFYQSVSDLPAFEDYSMAKRTYRYFPGKPLYPFGYGLSFTRFQYKCLECELNEVAASGAQVRVRVKNAGSMDGDEVVEVYSTAPSGAGVPLRSLVAFQRIHLAAGSSQDVALKLPARSLSVVAEDGSRSLVAGAYSLWIGGGQPGTQVPGVAGRLTVLAPVALPR